MTDSSFDIVEAARLLGKPSRRGQVLLTLSLLAIVVAFALLAVYFRQQAGVNQTLAAANGRLATANRIEADRWKAQADSVEQTLTQTRTAATASDWPQVRRLLNIASSEARDLQTSTAAAAQNPTTPPTDGPPVVAPVLPPAPAEARSKRVYIQFAAYPRGVIAGLNQGLRTAGWNAQGGTGERLVQATGLNELRYNPRDEAAAAPLADAVGHALGRPITLRPSGRIVPGTLELWVSR